MSKAVPIYRCERCGYWAPRNGQVWMSCPHCRSRSHKIGPLPMWPAYRAAPEEKVERQG